MMGVACCTKPVKACTGVTDLRGCRARRCSGLFAEVQEGVFLCHLLRLLLPVPVRLHHLHLCA